MTFNALMAQWVKTNSELHSLKQTLGQKGFSPEELPTGSQVRAIALLGEYGREQLEISSSDLVLLQSRGIAREYKSIDAVPTPTLRFLSVLLPFMADIPDVLSLLEAAARSEETPDFVAGTLITPDEIQLYGCGISAELQLQVRDVEFVGIVLPFGGTDMSVVAINEPSVLDLTVSAPLYSHFPEQQNLLVVGCKGGQVFRREVLVRILDEEATLDALVPVPVEIGLPTTEAGGAL
jgi:hypothetical protein